MQVPVTHNLAALHGRPVIHSTLSNRMDIPASHYATKVLRCPSDHADLDDDGARLRCSRCSKVYRADGTALIDFVGGSDYYWGEIPQEQMERVLEHARRHGYESAIDDLLGKEIDPSYRTSLREPTRVDWRLQLGMTKKHSALDVGSGWGRLGFALAEHIGHLYSLEYVPQRLEFQKIMHEQRRSANITLMRGSFLDLPFKPASLDWVIFNGVFEWVGLAGSDDPEQMQRAVLDRAFDIVKPGGHVAIAIENRWGINTFFGAIDHSGMPYTNLMPRRIADWWVRRHEARLRNDASSQGYRTYTYGLDGYLGLMRDAGADQSKGWALLPHYNTPRAMIPVAPLASYAAQAYAIDEVWQRASPSATVARTLLRLLVRAGVMRYIYPHYLVVGRKPC
jgi:ubiquinone/menaquinone biosynthesis C-methylase UbiE